MNDQPYSLGGNQPVRDPLEQAGCQLMTIEIIEFFGSPRTSFCRKISRPTKNYLVRKKTRRLVHTTFEYWCID